MALRLKHPVARDPDPVPPPTPAPTPAPSDEAWPAEWLRGALEVCVLGVLAEGPTYGYAIAAALEDAGLGAVKGGTLYPLLGRFEAAGLVDIEWRAGESGPGRKYYVLNNVGRDAYARRAAQWTTFTEVTRRLVAATTDSRTRSSARKDRR